MRKRIVAIAAVWMLSGATAWGAGGDCGCGCTELGCTEPGCAGPQCQTCTTTKLCKETVYDYQEETFYRQVFKEETRDRVISTMEFVEETRYRCTPCTIWQPQEECSCTACGAAATTPTCGCGASTPVKMVPVEIIKKVPYTVVVCKPVQKVEKVPQTVVTTEPYTITVCIPRTVYKEVEVPVCCPPTCCRDDSCGCAEPECCVGCEAGR